MIHHPLSIDLITEENHLNIADDLFRRQLQANIEYFSRVLLYGWTDDDTDYMRSACDATVRLMDLAYDHTRDDLVNFLFNRDPSGHDENLVDLDSAGGFCHALDSYLQWQMEEE